MKNLLFLYIILVSSYSESQVDKGYFRLPLNIPMQLAGNFAELRPNHFHAGFDLKTDQKEGLNVYAVADGYVSRIKISLVGYGKAIYITHPNGYTSVYGHLQKAVGAVQDKIVQMQYTDKSYEVELFFKPEDLRVKKGDIIGLSGNTGGSEGPHLHFEFRDNKTEHVINPLNFYDLKDTKKPIVSNVYVYPLDGNTVVNESKRPTAINLSLQKDGTYLADKVVASGKIGFGIIAGDYDDVSFNNNGVYKANISANGKIIFGYEFDKTIFDEAKYINAFIDYERYKKSRQRVQKLFMKNPFVWSNVKNNFENGILDCVPNFNQTTKIEVADFNGNTTTINIPVEYSNKTNIVPEEVKKTKYFIKYKNDAIFEKNNWSVSFPANTFYDDFYMNFDANDKILTVHEDIVPAHTNFVITKDATQFTDLDKNKLFIATYNNGKIGYLNTNFKDNSFVARTRTLGQFTIAKDTIAPKISISKKIEGKDISQQKDIRVIIADDLSGIKTYNGYINNEWVLFEFESKLKRLTYILDEKHLKEGTNTLKINVTDNVGNAASFSTEFMISLKK